MKSPPFDYHAPDTVDEAVALLAEYGDEAKVLAGGQSLIPILALRLAHPAVLVDIGAIAALHHVEVNGTLQIGAAVTQRHVERMADVGRVPLLASALPLIGHPQIRNRGTVCGSLAHADPAAELPATMLALDAVMVIRGPRGERTVPAAEFFESYLETAVAPDEVLTAVRIPLAPVAQGGQAQSGQAKGGQVIGEVMGGQVTSAIQEISRRSGDFALAGAAVRMVITPDGRVSEARIALFGVAPTPVRAIAAEQALMAAAPADAVIAEVAALAAGDLTPPSDVHATGAYRKHIAAVLVRRTLTAALTSAKRERA